MIRLVLVALLLTGCAHSDPWTTRDTVMQVGATVALAGDAYTTAQIQYHPGIYEKNPVSRQVLGLQPSTSATYQYFGTLIITNWLITRMLPTEWRPWWQGGTMVMHGSAWLNNEEKM